MFFLFSEKLLILALLLMLLLLHPLPLLFLLELPLLYDLLQVELSEPVVVLGRRRGRRRLPLHMHLLLLLLLLRLLLIRKLARGGRVLVPVSLLPDGLLLLLLLLLRLRRSHGDVRGRGEEAAVDRRGVYRCEPL